jgi:hypothetical protein
MTLGPMLPKPGPLVATVAGRIGGGMDLLAIGVCRCGNGDHRLRGTIVAPRPECSKRVGLQFSASACDGGIRALERGEFGLWPRVPHLLPLWSDTPRSEVNPL